MRLVDFEDPQLWTLFAGRRYASSQQNVACYPAVCLLSGWPVPPEAPEFEVQNFEPKVWNVRTGIDTCV